MKKIPGIALGKSWNSVFPFPYKPWVLIVTALLGRRMLLHNPYFELVLCIIFMKSVDIVMETTILTLIALHVYLCFKI